MKPLLHYAGQSLTEVPEEIRASPHITHLNLSQNAIRHLPDWLGELRHLRVLYLSGNQLSDIAALSSLEQLTVLHLHDNRIRQLPPTIGRLQGLKRLYLNNNALDRLGPELGQLRSLEQLLVANNRITEIAEEIGHLSRLQVLQMRQNQLLALPDFLSRLRALRFGDWSGNGLRQFPEALTQLEHLEVLHLYSNALVSFPTTWNERGRLRVLQLGDNQLETLDGLPLTLRSLSIYLNPLPHLPEALWRHFTQLDQRQGSPYLFVDSQQLQGWNREGIGEQGIKLLRLDSRELARSDVKYFPATIREQYGIKISDWPPRRG
ncbi:MAG: leucine-rich repeat protein [Bacteroidota bacterium]